MLHELQLDGLPGPTLFHGGLSPGNVASQGNAGGTSSPRAAALATLDKIRAVLGLGMPVAVLPPLPRPDVVFLRRCGFFGDVPAVLTAAATAAPELLRLASSSSFMWTANAATIAPSTDTEDGRLHAVVANLAAMPHRLLESNGRFTQLTALLAPLGGAVHPPLPGHPALGDEGAANHSRLASGGEVIHVFVHGRGFPAADSIAAPSRYPARQSLAGSLAVARLLALPAQRVLHVRQQAAAIDAGAFHNDVVMVGTRDRVLIHQQAWTDQPAVIQQLRQRLPGLRVAEISADDLSLADSVACYLFNSLLAPTPQGWAMVAPVECAADRPRRIIDRLLGEGFIDRVVFCDLRESMRGGGGPACLRLRLDLTSEELARVPPWARCDSARINQLESWVRRYYRDRLLPADLSDPALAAESAAALAEYSAVTGAPLLPE
ncbi:N-succinylarginine dihydrolase 1 [Planctomycetota bacterium]|nr:N-succinylarginine dihydrolase 1 [Planctomycetota bacterium]